MSRLTQVLIEDLYSIKSARDAIKQEIKSCEDAIWDSLSKKALYAIDDYRHQAYSYKSKNERIQDIADITNEELLYSAMASIMFHKESMDKIPVQMVVAKLATCMGNNTLTHAKTAAEILAVMAKSDLIDMFYEGDNFERRLYISCKFELEQETYQKIRRCFYLPPMVCKPNPHEPDCLNIDKSLISRSDGSLVLGKHNHHREEICLDVINILQSIPLKLCEYTLQQEEQPTSKLDTPQKITQFNKLKGDSLKVYEYLKDEEAFYLRWKVDFRGREYSQGYHVNIQSTGYKKALINLAQEEVVTGV